MKLHFFLLCSILIIFLPKFTVGRPISGRVLDDVSKEPIPYVSIGIRGKSIGTLSNEAGQFKLDIPEEYLSDTLQFHRLGFTSRKIKISSAIHLQLFYLHAEPQLLKEVMIMPKRIKSVIIGNVVQNKNIIYSFSQKGAGYEAGTIFHIKKNILLKNFNCYIITNDFDTAYFRLNIYSFERGMPKSNLLKKEIILKIANKEGIYTADLSSYNITLSDEVLISLEKLMQYNSGLKKIEFSGKLKPTRIFYKKVSQDNWERINSPLAPGFYFNAFQLN